MKNIKFKAFYKKYKSIEKVVEIDFEEELVILELQDDEDEEIYQITVGFDEIELLQYTGLDDKNGIEIYKGDILKFKGNIGEVKYYENMAGYEAETTDDYILGVHFHKSEVIGNKFKNEELLNAN